MIQIETGATDTLSAMVLYRNVMAEGTLVASTEAADGFAENALGPQTFDFWTPTAVPATLAVTLGADVSCDCAAIVAHTLGTDGATAFVEHYSGGAWVTAGTITPATDADILLIFPGQSSSQWRLRITGAVASVGVFMVGLRLLFPLGIRPDYVPVNLGLTVDLLPNITRGGQFLGNRVQRVGAGTSINLNPQERSWIEGAARDFIAHFNEGQPFMWASCPAILTDDASYCWRSGNTLSASYGAGAIYGNMSMEVAAYVGS